MRFDYHDGGLEAVAFGPRREIRMTIRLDPIWNPKMQGATAVVHLSAIEKYDEIKLRMSQVNLSTTINRIEMIKGAVRIDIDGMKLDILRCKTNETQGALE